MGIYFTMLQSREIFHSLNRQGLKSAKNAKSLFLNHEVHEEHEVFVRRFGWSGCREGGVMG